MNQLVLYLAADWPDAPHAHWVLLDARDRVVQSGHSDARHWPPADRLDPGRQRVRGLIPPAQPERCGVGPDIGLWLRGGQREPV